MDIKQKLQQFLDVPGTWEGRIPGITRLCREALTEIESDAEVIRTLKIELDIARAAVRAGMPEVAQLTRHTITLQKPLPAMEVGDSLLLVIVPPC
jgi:hypothetical protein